MIISYTKMFFAGVLFSLAASVQAVILEIEVWSDGEHYRYLLKDFHADYSDCCQTIQQHADIVWAIERNPDTFVLAEDTLAYTGSNEKMQNIFSQAPRTIQADIALIQRRHGIDPYAMRGCKTILPEDVTPLACLINVCRSKGIRHDNTECSQLIDVYQWQSLPEALKISRDEIIDDLAGHIAEIENASQAALTEDMQKLKQAAVIDLQAKMQGLKAVALRDDEMDFINHAMAIRWQLVAIKTVHKLVEWHDVKHGFVCEGTRHIEDIKVGLQALGYKPIEHIGNVDWSIPVPPDQIDEIKKKIISGALNVRKTFAKVFDQQQPRSTMRRVMTDYMVPVCATVAAAAIGVASWRYWHK